MINKFENDIKDMIETWGLILLDNEDGLYGVRGTDIIYQFKRVK